VSARRIRTLIVDDEPAGRRGVRLLLEADPEIEIVGECENGSQAVAAINDITPDLVFLDVQMPGMSGLDVLAAIHPERMPVVVFVTAYDQYALQAFEARALDYLLKPFSDRRFASALERAKDYVKREDLGTLASRLLELAREQGAASGEPAASPAPPAPEYLERIAVKSRDRVIFVEARLVDWVEARGDYLALHVGEGRHLLRSTMKEMECRLDPRRFARIHRSAIVNLDRIQELQPYFHGEYVVILRNGTRLRLSRHRREQLERQLAQRL
jgi:two-component system LytT family response regulator